MFTRPQSLAEPKRIVLKGIPRVHIYDGKGCVESITLHIEQALAKGKG